MRMVLEKSLQQTASVESPDCPLCSSSSARTLFIARDRLVGRPGEFPVVRCTSCGLVFLRPRPSSSVLGSFYPDTYYPLDQQPSREAFAVAEGLLARVIEWGRRQRLQVPSILDIGCGTGLFLHLAHEAGLYVRGIELSDSAVEYARARYGLDVHHGTLKNAELPDESFDIVTMWHVLEHLPNPVEALRRVARVLRPGGLLLLGVPNIDSIEARIFGRRWFSLDAPRHLSHFTPHTLAAVLNAAGLLPRQIIHSPGTAGLVYSVMGDLTGIMLKLRRQLSDSTYHRAANVLHRIARPLCAGAVRIGQGGALEAYAIKPNAGTLPAVGHVLQPASAGFVLSARCR